MVEGRRVDMLGKREKLGDEKILEKVILVEMRRKKVEKRDKDVGHNANFSVEGGERCRVGMR